MSIRSRLLWLAALIIVPVACAAAWILVAIYQREQQAVEQTLRETARALALVVDAELGQREGVLRALAASPSLERADYETFARQAVAATRESGDWVVLTDRDTVYVNTRLPDMLLQRPVNQPRVVAFLEAGTVVSNVFYANTVRTFVVTVQTVVESPQRGEPYNLFLTFPAASLEQLLRRQRLPAGWVAAVLDQRGIIVTRQPGAEQWTGKPATADLRTESRRRSEGFLASRTLDGTPSTAFYSRSPRYGWTFVIGVPKTTLSANLRRALLEAGVASIVLIGFAILAAILIGRRISQPAERLRQAARQLEEGGPFRFESTGVPEIDETGAALNRAAERIARGTEDLERKVAAAVEETRRVHERLSSVERLEALGRLTGGVAHDVNNLLAVITNNLYLLERLLPEAKDMAQIAAIRRAVDTGRALTQKLLAFARRRSTRPEVLSLQSWLPAAYQLLRTSLSSKIDVRIDVAADTSPIEIDATELELALVNLAVNADDAMPGGGMLSILARNAQPEEAGTDDQAGVVIEVRDTGAGMPPGVASRAFEPFFTTKEASRGSGLGLSQVYGACAQAGGTARIESQEGMGTTVYLCLPAATEAPRAPVATEPGPGPASGRLLYVEDNIDLAQTTQLVLEAFGYTVRHAANAAEALKLFDHERFDIVLSDVVMPGAMNGIELATRLRKLRPGLPVILITGYTTELDRVMEAGFEVLQKPCTPEALKAALARSIGHADRALATEGA